jgi:hypothetical protein
MDETTFKDSNSFLIDGKSFVVRYFPSTETTILVRTNSVPITQQETSQASNIDFAITSDGGINYGEIITSTNQFAPLGAPQQFSSDFVNSPQLQKTVLDTAKTVSGQSQPTPTAQNPDQQGGSAPITQPTTGTEPTAAMLVYPIDLGRSTQDRIMFQAYEYQSGISRLQGPTDSFGELNGVNYKKTNEPAVILPIQSAITDQNAVGWESDTLNPIEIEAAKLSRDLMTTDTANSDIAGDVAKKLSEALGRAKTGSNVQGANEAVRTYLVGQAIGVNSLLSRLQGQVLNPNLELLFQGPQLRPFSYTFKMSARSRTEAATIKKIIKYFKKNMAVKKDNFIFLKAPNVFKIQYQYSNSGKAHPGLNLIKMCALTNCSVDYTPLGTYMTFNDGTMIAYTMSLSFQELTPIYNTDYDREFDYGKDAGVVPATYYTTDNGIGP